MSLLQDTMMEILKTLEYAGSASFEVDGVGKNVWNCFLIVVTYSRNRPKGKDMSCVKHDTAVTRACVRCLDYGRQR